MKGDETPLMKAVYFQKIEAIKTLLDSGADISIKNKVQKLLCIMHNRVGKLPWHMLK